MQKCDFNKAEITLSHGCSSINCLNNPRRPFLTNTSELLLLYILKLIQHVLNYIVNFGQIFHVTVAFLLLTSTCNYRLDNVWYVKLNKPLDFTIYGLFERTFPWKLE